jgi:alkylated DNA repair dioxygenase AlkB
MEPKYIPNVYQLDTNVQELIDTVPWVSVKALRHECFMSPVTRKYQYDPGEHGHIYESVPFEGVGGLAVQQIMANINHTYNYSLNVCFLNYYENDTKGLHWHSDDSHPIDNEQPIAVVSFGAERDIWWRPMGYKGDIPQEWRQLLGNGSLFIMPPGMQQTHQHRIPKGDRPMGPRVSLTFRRYADGI